MGGSSRRLTLSPIGMDIVLAASQVPNGIRLTDLATVIGSPVSSVQTALRTLIDNALVRRVAGPAPRYTLAISHPAHEQLVALATVLPEAEHALAIMLRANPAVAFASVDAGGFVVAVDTAIGEASGRLERQLELIRQARDRRPAMVRIPAPEFARLVAVDLELRTRLEAGVTLKGSLPRPAGRNGGGLLRSLHQSGA